MCVHECACVSVHTPWGTTTWMRQSEENESSSFSDSCSLQCPVKLGILPCVSNFHFIIGVLGLQIYTTTSDFMYVLGMGFEFVSSCILNKPSSYWLISSAKASSYLYLTYSSWTISAHCVTFTCMTIGTLQGSDSVSPAPNSFLQQSDAKLSKHVAKSSLCLYFW